MKTRHVSSAEYNLVRFFMLFNIWWIGARLYKNPFKAFGVVRLLIRNFTEMMGHEKLVRAFKTDGKYHWDMFNPTWPSKGFNAFFRTHLLELKPVQAARNYALQDYTNSRIACAISASNSGVTLTSGKRKVAPIIPRSLSAAFTPAGFP